MDKPEQNDLDRDRQYCELCGKMENLLKCGRCRSSFYCSKEHQKQDWRKHKLVCKEADNKAALLPGPSEEDKDKTRDTTSPEQPAAGDGAGDADAPATPNGQTSSLSPQKLATECIVPCMNKHGICVVDAFLGLETGLSVLDNVQALYDTGRFTDGQLVSQKSDSTKDIRGDKITWIEGSEAGCDKIQLLMGRMDDIIRHCNGKLGNYSINGRTKKSTTNNNSLHDGKTSWTLHQAAVLTESILKIVTDMRPPSMVEDEGFTTTIYTFNPGYTLPSRTHFTK